MLHINRRSIQFRPSTVQRLRKLTAELIKLPPDERRDFIDRGRTQSWGHKEVVEALKSVVGNKCWYSEVCLDGHDPEVDHFRPKGTIREVDPVSFKSGGECEGYWWLAFECENYRLAAKHSNQRRLAKDSNGGKANYFPVKGDRAIAGTPCQRLFAEFAVALDPTEVEDVRMLSFDSDGVALPAKPKGKDLNEEQRGRVIFSIWLYHLNEKEIRTARGEHLRQIFTELSLANDDYETWICDQNSNRAARDQFFRRVDALTLAREPTRLFAGAVDRIIRMSAADYPWLLDYIL